MLGGISRSTYVVSTNGTNATRSFECHPGGESHATLLLSVASSGVLANLSLAAIIMSKKALRRWSSGLLLHGTVVDGTRAALLIPMGLSVYKCQPMRRCSLIDTAFLLLATVSSLNLLTASLSDAPLLPPPVLAPQLLESAGYFRAQSSGHYDSPLYPKDYYEEDASLLSESMAMPDSPQCVLFGTFIVWFAALTINLGPTFLSGALAAHAGITPNMPSCPLVRGPERHAILNILWAGVNLLCVGLAAAQLRNLKKDLAHAKIGLLAAAGAGLAGMTGITNTVGKIAQQQQQQQDNGPGSSKNAQKDSISRRQSSGLKTGISGSSRITPSELDAFMRKAQIRGRYHIRTLGTLAIVNLICWVPLYICAVGVKPVGSAKWTDDPGLYIYEICLLMAFAHSAIHPLLLLCLHEPLRSSFRSCLSNWVCCLCIAIQPQQNNYPLQQQQQLTISDHDLHHNELNLNTRRCSSSQSQRRIRELQKQHSVNSQNDDGSLLQTINLKRSCSIKSVDCDSMDGRDRDRDRNLAASPSSISPLPEDLLPPPPFPPSVINVNFRKLI